MDYEKLRPHQKEAVRLLRGSWKKHRTHLIYGPVGMGKTALASYVIGSFAEKGLRALFIAPYTTLVEQTAQRFIEYGLPEPGIIWRDHPGYDPSSLVQIASADTLLRREWPEVDVVFVDECHIRRAKLLEIMESSSIPFIGLSGSPFAKWLGNYYETLIKPCSMRDLIDQGYLSDYAFYAPSVPNLKGVKVRAGDYVEEELARVMDDYDLIGDIVSHWLRHGENRSTIAFCCNVAHAGHITSEFQRNNISAEIMTAKTPHDERRQIIERFEEGVTKVICNVGVLVAGFDSDVRCVIYARPTKSEMRWIQCLGRGLRSAPGKHECLIFDHSGTVHRLGYPDCIEYDELPREGDGQKDQKQQEKEKLEKLPKQCTQCDYMKPPGVKKCPKCGYNPVGGEDVDTDYTREIERLDGAQPKYTKEDKQKFYSELKGYQRERANKGKPIKDGWVNHKYKEKFGVWPRDMKEIPVAPGVEVRNWIKSQNIRFAKGQEKGKKMLENLVNSL